MDVEIGSEDQLVDLYWIVQRRHLVREGETMCPNSNKKCYKSSKRRQKSPTNLFELQLAIDVLSEADIEDPIVLVKDFRNRNGQDVIEVFYVPKTSKDDLNDDSHDNDDDDDDDENDDDDMKRKRLNKNNRLKPKEGQGDECLEFCGQPVCVTTVRSLVRIQFKKEELQIEVKRYIFWR